MPHKHAADDDLLGHPEQSPLRALLMKACPPDPATGQRTVIRLARLMVAKDKPNGLDSEAIFKWIRNNRIPPLMAARVVDLAEGRVTLGDFTPFIFFENLDTDD